MLDVLFDLQMFTGGNNGEIESEDLARVRNIDFTEQFSKGIDSLMKMLGVTRKVKKAEGSALKAYKVTGSLESGSVAEGALIPLSHYATSYETVGTATLNKWRKRTTAEAIVEKGYDQAVNDTNVKMIKDIQTGIRSSFVSFLATGTATASGDNLQKCLAQIWGKLKILFEDASFVPVYFINPMDAADYLGVAQITTQTAFGMGYLENFLGLGTAIFDSNVPEGTVYATAQENIVLYYIAVDESGMKQAFDLTTDATALIGVNDYPVKDYASVDTVAFSGVGLFAEQLGGIVVGTIGDSQGLDDLTVSSQAGTASGDTKITVTEELGTGHSYKIKVGTNVTFPDYGQIVRNWTSWDGTSDITAATGKQLIVVECDANYQAVKAGICTVTANS